MFRITAIVTLALLGTACVERKVVDVSTPLAESGDLLDGQTLVSLRFRNGALVEFGNATLLGDWVCGRPPGLGTVCIEGERVVAVEHREVLRHSTAERANQGFAIVFFAPIIGLFAMNDAEQKRGDEADLKARLQDAWLDQEQWALARGEPSPPPMTLEALPLHESFVRMLNCRDIDRIPERASTDGETLAGEIWAARDKCVPMAAKWYLAAGRTDRARRLTFIANARARFEDVACGNQDSNLPPPEKALVTTSPRGWMNEYRAVVRDRATYDYEMSRQSCRSSQGGPDRAGALNKVTAGFPLTAWAVPTPSTDPVG